MRSGCGITQSRRSSKAYHAVATLIDGARHVALSELLRSIGDLERILARVALRSARPRDLTQLRAALGALPGVHRSLRTMLESAPSPLLQQLLDELSDHRDEHAVLERAVVEAPPHYLRDGGVIAPGYDAELDELRLLGSNTEQFLLELERRERERTGLSSLKLGFNRVQGFFIEVNRSQADRVPSDYLRRQTVKSAERFITPELKSFEDKVLGARDRALAREKELYDALLTALTARLPALQQTTAAIAQIDVLTCFAERAATLDCARPELVDHPMLFISQGRHPVVERAGREPFIPNDLRFDEARRMLIITGPNMGGKSTYMRQAALIAILAHIGCFVPAKRAVLGPLDRIFTRIGASDDLAGGRSTFMLEMTETANILNNATDKSLHLRRVVIGLGLRRIHRRQDPRIHPVCHALFRTHQSRHRGARRGQRARRGGRTRRQAGVPAQREGGSCQSKLRPASGGARRHP